MKKIKFISIVIWGIFSLLAFLSCDDDDSYSLGDYWISRATINPLGNNAYSLLLDNGENLWIASNQVPHYVPKENQRAFIDYTILSDEVGDYDHYIRLNDIKNILTKNTITLTAANADSIGNDPIKIGKIWSGGGFLNVNFGYNYGGTRTHMINLAKNTTVENPSDGKIYLELRHNAYNDPQKVGAVGYVCFDLKPFREEGKDSLTFVIKATEFEGDNSYEITYKYSDYNSFDVIESVNLSGISATGYE